MSSTNSDCSDQNKSASTILIEATQERGVEFFHDQFSNPYASIPVDRHREVWPCTGDRFKNWLGHLYWMRKGKGISQTALGEAINVFKAQSLFDGEQKTLLNRVAWHKGDIYFDLADKRWRAVKITEEGWEIVTDPPILFRRHSHQCAQVDPVGGGNLDDVFRFINLKGKQQRLLFKSQLVTSLIPHIPHPPAVLHGPQGSAKTTLFRIKRRLIDPSQMELLTFPRSKEELIQQLSHHWAVFFDNVSWIAPWLSDVLCRAVTGEGFSKRQLYTTDDDFIYRFRCCIGINGIHIVPQKPDLMDRSILYQLSQIPPDRRQPEQAILEEFELIRPQIFGAMLDALSFAMGFISVVELNHLPRMADFARWGAAVAAAFDHDEDEFLQAYQDNITRRNEEVLASQILNSIVWEIMADKDSWEGSATELFHEIGKIAQKKKVTAVDLPRSAAALTRKLNEVRPNLEAAGITVTTGIRTSKERQIHMTKRTSTLV